MARTTKEWQGKNDDSPIPPRVKDRTISKFDGRCASCGVAIRRSVDRAFDHVVALINGGEHRESNLQLLCVPCHSQKTKRDMACKAMAYRKRSKHLGLIAPRKKIPSRGFAASEPQRTASRPLRKKLP